MADSLSPDYSYNRYSMPVTRSRTGLYGADLDQTGTARFLFGEEDTSGENKYGQNNGDDKFPTLVRRDDQMVSQFPCLVFVYQFGIRTPQQWFGFLKCMS